MNDNVRILTPEGMFEFEGQKVYARKFTGGLFNAEEIREWLETSGKRVAYSLTVTFTVHEEKLLVTHEDGHCVVVNADDWVYVDALGEIIVNPHKTFEFKYTQIASI